MSNVDLGIMGLMDRLRELEEQNQFLRLENERLAVQLDQLNENLMPQDTTMGLVGGRGFLMPKGTLKKIYGRLNPQDLRLTGHRSAHDALYKALNESIATKLSQYMVFGVGMDHQGFPTIHSATPNCYIYFWMRPMYEGEVRAYDQERGVLAPGEADVGIAPENHKELPK